MNIDDDSYSDFMKGSLVNKDSNQGSSSNSPASTNHMAVDDRFYSPLIGWRIIFEFNPNHQV